MEGHDRVPRQILVVASFIPRNGMPSKFAAFISNFYLDFQVGTFVPTVLEMEPHLYMFKVSLHFQWWENETDNIWTTLMTTIHYIYKSTFNISIIRSLLSYKRKYFIFKGNEKKN